MHLRSLPAKLNSVARWLKTTCPKKKKKNPHSITTSHSTPLPLSTLASLRSKSAVTCCKHSEHFGDQFPLPRTSTAVALSLSHFQEVEASVLTHSELIEGRGDMVELTLVPLKSQKFPLRFCRMERTRTVRCPHQCSEMKTPTVMCTHQTMGLPPGGESSRS